MSIASYTKNTKIRQGFLLPDVMIAVFVTATTILAILSVMVPLFTSEFFKRDEVIATNLAQEGIELVRNARDNNWKDASVRTAFEAPFPASGKTYCIDYTMTAPFPLCSVSNQYVAPDNVTGLYTISSGARFQRTIDVSTPPAPNDTTRFVVSTVTWGIGSSLHTVSLTDTLTDWGDK
jgi:Tfp pilus assembly protein PilV